MNAPGTAAAGDTVSVVVLTHNRREWLRATLRQLCGLPERPPLAVVDNGSIDGTAEMVKKDFPGVTLLRSPENIGAAARNLGARWAWTPYIAFCDDDTWWEAGALRLAANMLERHADVAALAARVVVLSERTAAYEDAISALMANSPLPSEGLPGRAILGLMAGATVFRARAFLDAGGYHPRLFIGGEETLLALDLVVRGWHLVYVPALTVYHHPCPIREVKRRKGLLARNAIWSAWLRLPVGAAVRLSLSHLPALLRESGAAGCVDLCRGLPWIWRERRVIPRHVEAMRRAVDAARLQ